MKNPWTKKNPFLSMWLSGANAIAGSARSRITAEGRRQATTLVNRSIDETMNFWTRAWLAPPPPKRRKRTP